MIKQICESKTNTFILVRVVFVLFLKNRLVIYLCKDVKKRVQVYASNNIKYFIASKLFL